MRHFVRERVLTGTPHNLYEASTSVYFLLLLFVPSHYYPPYLPSPSCTPVHTSTTYTYSLVAIDTLYIHHVYTSVSPLYVLPVCTSARKGRFIACVYHRHCGQSPTVCPYAAGGMGRTQHCTFPRRSCVRYYVYIDVKGMVCIKHSCYSTHF